MTHPDLLHMQFDMARSLPNWRNMLGSTTTKFLLISLISTKWTVCRRGFLISCSGMVAVTLQDVNIRFNYPVRFKILGLSNFAKAALAKQGCLRCLPGSIYQSIRLGSLWLRWLQKLLCFTASPIFSTILFTSAWGHCPMCLFFAFPCRPIHVHSALLPRVLTTWQEFKLHCCMCVYIYIYI